MKKEYYIGLDVHKESVAIAYTFSGARSEASYYGECGGSNHSVENSLRKLAKRIGVELQELKVCYEAGPTGFVLARHLINLGLDCTVMAPSKTERKPNEKVKTDKRDAKLIAKLFRNGDVVPVRIPPSLDEAVRDVCRARTDASDDLSRAKKRLNSFLLRIGHSYRGKSNWTTAHMGYLRSLSLPSKAHNIVLEEYIRAIESCMARVERLSAKLKDLLTEWEWEPAVRALMACKGFQEIAAMTIVSELGDLRRFSHPRKLMAYLGLVPGESSSGTKRRLGSITKCGNTHARWMLVECAQHFRRTPKIGVTLTKRQEGQSGEVKALSWRMQNRLNHRYRRLKARGVMEQKCVIALARELAGFIWELLTKCKLELPVNEPQVNS